MRCVTLNSDSLNPRRQAVSDRIAPVWLRLSRPATRLDEQRNTAPDAYRPEANPCDQRLVLGSDKECSDLAVSLRVLDRPFTLFDFLLSQTSERLLFSFPTKQSRFALHKLSCEMPALRRSNPKLLVRDHRA